MKPLMLNGIRRAKGIRMTIPAKEGKRADDLLDRAFTAPAPNRTWVMDFTYLRTLAGFTNVSFIVDVFAQKIITWHTATNQDVSLVMTPIGMGNPATQAQSTPHRTR